KKWADRAIPPRRRPGDHVPAVTSRLDRLGRAAARHPGRTIVAWVLVAVGLVVGGSVAGGEYNDNYKIPGVQSQAAIDRLQADFPAAAGSTNNQVVLHARAGTLADPQYRPLAAALQSVSKLPHVVGVVPPTPGRTVSADGTT